jgi:hypothetical protein
MAGECRDVPPVKKMVRAMGRDEAFVALCDKDRPFVSPGGPSGGIYELEKAISACPEVTTE